MKYGYVRVSTRRQATEGYGLDVQKKEVIEAGAECIYEDVYTGTKKEREGLKELLTIVGRGDEIIVTKLDRLARSARDGIAIMQDLIDRGVRVNILNMGVAEDTPMGRMMVTMLLAFAEFERDLIVERTMEGKERKRLEDPDWHDGAEAVYTEDDLLAVLIDVEDHGMSITKACKKHGIGRTTYYRLKSAYGV